MSDYVNEIEASPDAVKLLFKDKLEMIIDRLYQNKINDTIKRLRSRAKLSEPDACTQSIVYDINSIHHLNNLCTLKKIRRYKMCKIRYQGERRKSSIRR